MRFRIQLAAAWVCSIAVIATSRTVCAQSQQTGMVRGSAPTTTQNTAVEELPTGQLPAGQMPPGAMTTETQPHVYYPGGPGEGPLMMNGPSAGDCGDGSCSSPCGNPCCYQSCGAPDCGCAPPCGAPGCGCERPCCPPGCGCESSCCDTCQDSKFDWFGCGGGHFCVFVDYLNVRATFSDATAFVDQDLAEGEDEFVPFEFGRESSFRIGGAYKLCHCGEQVRFMYTRMTGDDETTAFPGDIVPFAAAPPPGGRTEIKADVDTNALDVEWAKTIPLGGQLGECGDGCGKRCPAWDITWSAGLRLADVSWERNYTALDNTDFALTDVDTEMDFRGAGLRAGVEGRRYFFKDGWLSVYGKGNISLLVGDVDIDTERVSDDGQGLIVVVSQEFSNRQIIPVTELEAGITAQVTCHSAFTAGYLMTAWHDLGFRDAGVCGCDGGTLLGSNFDDANILGFEGFFARLEWCF
jgi:major outer membrane protein